MLCIRRFSFGDERGWIPLSDNRPTSASAVYGFFSLEGTNVRVDSRERRSNLLFSPFSAVTPSISPVIEAGDVDEAWSTPHR